MQLSSAAFEEGGQIPPRYTCDGEDVSPPVSWDAVPAGTAELALVMDDPDARGFVHWVVVGIPPAAGQLAEGQLPAGTRQGRNDFGGTGYRGPCPPSGSHRYVLTLYALSAPIAVSDAPTAEEVRTAAAGLTLGEERLSTSYARR